MPGLRVCRFTALFAGTVLAVSALAPAGGADAAGSTVAPVPASIGTSIGLAQGLVAFRDTDGIGVADPVTGRERLLLAIPPSCARATPVPLLQLAGPVWATSAGTAPELYFWLTDWQMTAAACRGLPVPPSSLAATALLVEADPVTGSVRALAAAPNGLPCEPGADLAAAAGTLAFTNGGCDEPVIETLPAHLSAVAQPQPVTPSVTARAFCDCAVAQRLLGTGPNGTFVFEEVGTQTASAPPPSLQSFAHSGHQGQLLLPRPPRATWGELTAAAAAPAGGLEAFAAGTAGAGILNLKTGTWSPATLPACRAACSGASSVSFSPDGDELAIAADGALVLDPVGGGRPRTLMSGQGVSAVSWSGPMTATVPGTAGAGSVPPPLGRVLPSLWASFSGFWGAGLNHTWRVAPIPGRSAVPATWPVMVASPPGTPTALLMASDQLAIAAGADGAMWRSTDGGRTWTTVTAHCAQLRMVTPDFPPCEIHDMAALRGGVLLAGGRLGVWRSDDGGLQWHRDAMTGYVVQGGPWAAGATALVLVEPAGPGGQAEAGSTDLTLLASTDGAHSWHELLAVPRRYPAPGAASALFDEYFVLGPGRMAVLYGTGDCSLPSYLRLTKDGGTSWSSITVPPLLAPAVVAQASRSRIAVGSRFCGSGAPFYGQGIFTHAAAAGGTWAPVGLPSGYYNLDGLGSSGRYPRSAPAVEAFSVAGLAFPGMGEAVAVGAAVPTALDSQGNPDATPAGPGSQGMLLVSSDGGATFADASVPGLSSLELLSCADAGHCLAAQG